MFIEVNDNNGKPTCKKNIIFTIVRLDGFDDGKPDFIKRLKDSFKNGNQIIPSLYTYVEKKPVKDVYYMFFNEGDPDCIGHNKLFSNAESICLSNALTLQLEFSHSCS